MDRLQIDLMDFRTTPDGEYTWILQIKDTFSRYIWLYGLKDKSAPSVYAILLAFFGQVGYPLKM